MEKTLFKATFITGLQTVVQDEIQIYPQITLNHIEENFAYLNNNSPMELLVNLQSVTNIFITTSDTTYNPAYICRHKSTLGNLIAKVLTHQEFNFKSFELSCAGQESQEIQEIKKYISNTFKLEFKKIHADLKIFIGKNKTHWEIGVGITPRPLTQRNYRASHIEGSLNPTIAYAMNSLLDLGNSKNYLNIFSGNATLLIEAALTNPNNIYLGFDIDGKRIAESIKNIKTAGFIKKINITKADIFDNPEFGKFDTITTDLPFGMKILKNGQLEILYSTTLDYIKNNLNTNGTAVIYTTEYVLLEKLMFEKKMGIQTELPLKIITSVNSYLYPKIIVYKNK
jgi:23S rRNA G2445 N2-methylase RlmL